MLTAAKLAALADGAEHLAALRRGAGAPYSEIQPLEIAAADARAMIDAGSGFATPETMHAAMVLANDAAIAKRVHELTRGAIAGAYTDRIPDDADAAARVGLADALAEYVENDLSGFEGCIVGPTGTRVVELPDMAHALARCGFRSVDWMDLARHYIAEEKLNPTTGAAS